MVIFENVDIDIDKAILENIDIDKAILKNIDIDRKSLRNINIDIDKEIIKIHFLEYAILSVLSVRPSAKF